MNENFYTEIRQRIADRGTPVIPEKLPKGISEIKKEQHKKWVEKNHDRVLEYAKKYKLEHAEQTKAYHLEYQRSGRRKKHDATYRERHREQLNAYNREYRKRKRLELKQKETLKNDFEL